MDKKFYFMAGLPRAGSTLLSTLLNQNPRFHSGPSSPVLGAMFSLHDNFQGNELYTGYPKPDQANEIVGSVIRHWYSDIEQEVIFDKNRAWTARVPFIEGYIRQEAKIIVPVRRVDEILASLLTMVHRNTFVEGQPRINFVDEQLVKANIPINDHNRCEYLLTQHGGIVWESLNATKLGVDEGHRDKLHFVDYNDLVIDPQGELNDIYEFLGEEPFEHTFDGLSNEHREDDLTTYGLSDMHEVHSKLEKISPDPSEVLPESIIKLYNENKKNLEFWDNISTMKIDPINTSSMVKPPQTKINTYNLFTQ
jgi:sulfotransferase